MENNNNRIVIYNTNRFERIEIENVPEFSVKAFNIFNKQVLALTADRFYMENVSF